MTAITRPTCEVTPRNDRAASNRRFETVLVVSRGEVYVPALACPDTGWLVRAAAGHRRATEALPVAA